MPGLYSEEKGALVCQCVFGTYCVYDYELLLP